MKEIAGKLIGRSFATTSKTEQFLEITEITRRVSEQQPDQDNGFQMANYDTEEIETRMSNPLISQTVNEALEEFKPTTKVSNSRVVSFGTESNTRSQSNPRKVNFNEENNEVKQISV